MNIESLKTILTPPLEGLGLTLWGLECQTQGHRVVLRVFIDKDSGASITDCEKASRQMSAVLDVEDPFAGRFTLEVSTPGIDRQLFEPAQYQHYLGSVVKIKLAEPMEGRRKLKGTLVSIEGETVVLDVEGEAVSLPLNMIRKANLVC